MAFENKQIYDVIRILTLLLIALPFAASTNINCDGKSFHCVNSTHFMICVDLGGGVSSTIDGFVIPCPPTTECQATHRFECEFPSTTVTNVVTSVPSAAEHSETIVSDSPITITPYRVSDARILDNNIESTSRLQNNATKNIPVTLSADILTTESTKISEDITLQTPLQKRNSTNNIKYTEIFDLSKEFNVTSKQITNQEAMITTAIPVKKIEYATKPPATNLTKTDSLVPFVILGEEKVALDPLLNIDLLDNSLKDIELTAGTTYDTTETQISTQEYKVTTESAIITALTPEHNNTGHIKTDVSKNSLLINMSLGYETKQDNLITNTTELLKINVTNLEVIEPRLYIELSTENPITTISKAIDGTDMEVIQSTALVNIFKDVKTFSTNNASTENRPLTPSNYNLLETTTTVNILKEDKTFNNLSTGSENIPSTPFNYNLLETTTSVNIFKKDETFSTISTGTENIPSTLSNYDPLETTISVNIFKEDQSFSTISTGTENIHSMPSNYYPLETTASVNILKEDKTFSAISTGTKNIPSTSTNYNLLETTTSVNIFKDDKTFSTISTGTENIPSMPSNYNPLETTASVNILKEDKTFSAISTGTENIPSKSSNYNLLETTTSVNIFKDDKTFSTISTGTENIPSTPSNYNPLETTASVNILKEDKTISTISTDTENIPSTPSNYTPLETTASVIIFKEDKSFSTISTGTENIPSILSNYNPSEITTSVNIFKEGNIFRTIDTGTEISLSMPSDPLEAEVILENIIPTELNSRKKSTPVPTVQNNINTDILNRFSTISVNHNMLENFVTTEQSLKNEETTERIAVTTLDTMDITKLEKILLTSTAKSTSIDDVTLLDIVSQHKFTASLPNIKVNRPITIEPNIKTEVTTEISTLNSMQTNDISNGVEIVEAVTSNSVKSTLYTEFASESVLTTQQDLQNKGTKEQVVKITLNVGGTNKTKEIITTTKNNSIPMEQDLLRNSTLTNYKADRTSATVQDLSLKNEVTVSALQINNNIDGEEIIEATTRNSFETTKPSFMVQQRLENAETTEKNGKLIFNMTVSNIIEDVVDFAKGDTILSMTNVMKGFKGSTSTILSNTESKLKVENNKVTLEKKSSIKNESSLNVEMTDFTPSESLSTQPVNDFTTTKINTKFLRLQNATTLESSTTPTFNLKDNKENIVHSTSTNNSIFNMVNAIGDDGTKNISNPNAELEVLTNGTHLDSNLKNKSTSETNTSVFSFKKTNIRGAEEMTQLLHLEGGTIFKDLTTSDATSTQNIPKKEVSATELTILKTAQGNNKTVFEPSISDYISATETIISTTNEGQQHITTFVENMQLTAEIISEKVKAPDKNINSPTATLNTNENNDFEVIPNITLNNMTIQIALAVPNITTHDRIKMFNNLNILEGNSMAQVTTESVTKKSTSAYNNKDSEKFVTVGNESTTEQNVGIVNDTLKDSLKIDNISNNIPDNLTATGRNYMPRNITTPGINDKIQSTLTESSTISSKAILIPRVEGLTVTTKELNLNTKKYMDYNTHENAMSEPTTFDTQITTESFLKERTLKYDEIWNKQSERDILLAKKDSKSKESTRDNVLVNGLARPSTQNTIISDTSDGLNKNLLDIIRIDMVTTKPTKQLIVEQSTKSDFLTQSPDSNKLETAKMVTGAKESLMKIEKDGYLDIEKLASNQNLKTTTNTINTQLSKTTNKKQSLNIPIGITEVMSNRGEKHQTQNLEDVNTSLNIKKQESFENKYLINNNSDSNVTKTVMEISQSHLHNTTSNILGANSDPSGSDPSMSSSVEKLASAQNTRDANTKHYNVISNGTYFHEKSDIHSKVKDVMDIHQSMIRKDEIKDSQQNQSSSIIRDTYIKNVSNETLLQDQGIQTVESFQNDKIIIDKDPTDSKNVMYSTLNIKVSNPWADKTVKMESKQNVNSQLDQHAAISKTSVVTQQYLQGNVTTLNNVKTPNAEKNYPNINNFTTLAMHTNATSKSNDLKEFNDKTLGTNVSIYERDSPVSLKQNTKVENKSMSIMNSWIKNEAGKRDSIPQLETPFHSMQISAEPNNKQVTGSLKEMNDTQVNKTISVASTRNLANKSEDLTTLSDKFMSISQVFDNVQVTMPMSKKLTTVDYYTEVNPYLVHNKLDKHYGILARNYTQTSLTEAFKEGTLQKPELTPSTENLGKVKSEKEKEYFSEVAQIKLETAVTGSPLAGKDTILIHGINADIMKNGDMVVEYDLKNVTSGTSHLLLKLKPQTMQNENQFHNKSSMSLKPIPLETNSTININPLEGMNKFNNRSSTSAPEIIHTIPERKEYKDQIYKIEIKTPNKNFSEQIQGDNEFMNVLSTSDHKSTSMSDFNSFEGTPTSVTLQTFKTNKIKIVPEVAKPISSDLLYLNNSPTMNKTQDIYVSLNKNISKSNQNIYESRKSQATYDAITDGLIERAIPEYAMIYKKNKVVITKSQNNVVSTPESVNKNNAERNKEIHLTEKFGLSTNTKINDSTSIPNAIKISNADTLMGQNKNPHVYEKSNTNEQSQVASAFYSEDTVNKTNVKHDTSNKTKEEKSSNSLHKTENNNKKSQENYDKSENSIKFYCRHKNRGRYSDREDCQKFYICIGRDEPIVGRCPQNTVFSDIRKQCTNNLSHCTRLSEFRCMSQGRFSDILGDNIYYICVSNGNHFVRFKFQCHKGYLLNKTSVKCYRRSESESNLQTSRKSSEYSSKSERSERREGSVKDKSQEKHKINDENKSVHFDCESEGKFAHPNDCRKYYVCTTNKKSEFRRKRKKCDSDEVFHKDKKECVDADSYEC